MNKRLYIVVEGQTEEEFVKSLLAPYFQKENIYIYPVIIHTSKRHKGGFVNYVHLKNDVNRLLHSQGDDVVVTTFIDYFRCPQLPQREKWEVIQNHVKRVEQMECVMSADVSDWRFIPYIQLHEFEALLFSAIDGFNKYFDKNIVKQIYAIIGKYDNPEDINSSPEGAPSKRLLRIIQGYDKVMYGNTVALEIGIIKILDKCPRFRKWIGVLIQKCKE